MREHIELRIPDDEASKFLPESLGKRKGIARIIHLERDSLWYEKIARIDKQYRNGGRAFAVSWYIQRNYNKAELASAELFHLIPTSFFEPHGEERGTVYDETRACPACGSGAPQVTDLALPIRRIPKKKDLSSTIANEWVVSARLAELLRTNQITGCEIRPVRNNSLSGQVSENWFQLVVTDTNAEVSPATRTGIKPFNKDVNNEYRCRKGDLIGLRLISEVSVNRLSYSGCDMVATRQFVGLRSGVLRPERIVLISPRLRELLDQHKIKGYRVEVAHLV
jgi:hypothetical protein